MNVFIVLACVAWVAGPSYSQTTPDGWTRITADTVGYRGLRSTSGPPALPAVLARRAGDTRPWRTAIVARFARDTLGAPWPRGRDVTKPGPCDTFHLGSHAPDEHVFWLYRCREPVAAGQLEAESFLLSADSQPTRERTRWSAGPASVPGGAPLAAIADTLAAELALGLGQQPRPLREHVHGPPFGDWTLIADVASAWGRLRMFQAGDSLIIEHASRKLVETLGRAWDEGSPYEPSEPLFADSPRRARAREDIVRALEKAKPGLARALAKDPCLPEDAALIGSAVAAALRAPATEASNLVLWAGHLWCRSVAWDPADSAATRALDTALRPVGASRVRMPDGECWSDSLAEVLVARGGVDTWTDRAFLDLMRRGWQSRCEFCGWDPDVGTDLFRPVIARGDSFLRLHGDSPIACEVRWLVAEAHETAWSLSKVPPCDEYIDGAGYARDAPGHRRRAITLYESLLKAEPEGRRRTAALNRLARLRLDVDTGYRPFWCMWD